MGAPLDAERFAALMAPLAPFGPAPRLAVGVSGGPDSLALALLAEDWARARGGHAVALTVNHGLRADAADEARRVAAWMAAAGVAHETLTVPGPAPSSGVQAWARSRRLEALEAACRRLGLLDLLLAHHREDLAETVLQRLGQGSGPDGLAAMAPVAFRPGIRVLRPLLTVPAEDLRASLRARGQAWIDDPSNADPAFQRVRVRRLGPALAEAGVTRDGVAMAAGAPPNRGPSAASAACRPSAGGGAPACRPGLRRSRRDRCWRPPTARLARPLGAFWPASAARTPAARGRPAPPVGTPARRPARRHTGGADAGALPLAPLERRTDGQAGWMVWREARHLPAPVPLPDLPTVPADGWLWDGRFRRDGRA